MFEVEGGGEVSLANVDKFTADDAGWRATFIELTADGTLPRDRVLTSALSALNRDFSAYRAGWYSRLYDAHAPTADEVAEHQAQLRTLLRSTIPATVTFAVTKLRQVSKSNALDGSATLTALAPAMVTGPKTTAVSSLKLAEDIAARHPELATGASEVAGAALDHPHADVQKAAGTLLRKLGAEHRLVAAADLLEPSVQADLLARRPQATEERSTRTAAAPTVAALAPVSADDLLDRVAALLEDARDALEVELVLAALASLDDPERLRPLTKRAASILKRGPREGVTRLWLRGQLARLVLAGIGSDLAPRPLPTDPTTAFVAARLDGVEEVLRRMRPPRLLLATPDDALGWLTPNAFVDRLVAQGGSAPDQHDLVAAMLRLHPEGRAEALTRLEDIRGIVDSTAEIARYALGGPPPAPSRTRLLRAAGLEDVPLWVAASRSRLPTGQDEWLRSRGVTGAGRSGPLDAAVVFQGHPHSWSERGQIHHSTYWTWAVEVADAADVTDSLQPTAISGGTHDPLLAWPSGAAMWAAVAIEPTAWMRHLVGWLALIWPHDSEHFLVAGIHSALRAATSTEVSHDAVRVLAAIGNHPGRIGALAETALAAGLNASKADQRAAAVDAVLQLSRTGALSPAALARGLASFLRAARGVSIGPPYVLGLPKPASNWSRRASWPIAAPGGSTRPAITAPGATSP